MHFMPDTEDEDSAAETFWPEGYKEVIRGDIRQLIGTRLGGEKMLEHVYRQQYSEKYPDLNQFTDKIADMLGIAAENGADETFDEIIDAFLEESPLPEVPRYARYVMSRTFPREVKEKLRQVIIDEYSQDDIYANAYSVGYGPDARDGLESKGSYATLGEFVEQIARLVVDGTENGADDMLEAIYEAFITSAPLPPARRHPRRLKIW